MNGSLETIDGRPALRFERRLAHPVKRVWRAITDPAELERWYPAAADWKPQAGEVFEAGGHTGEVTELEEERILDWTFAGQRFRFELSAEGDGCALVFIHVFDERSLAAQTAAGWETYFARLDEHLAGRRLSEDQAHEPIGELHEGYAERFGLDELHHWFPGDLEATESEPPHLMAGTWYGDSLRIELRPEGEGCALVFAHWFADRDKAARDAAGWDRCFARLDALLGGQPMDEATSLELWPSVHERYAERWEIDPEVGRKAYAEHPAT